MKEFYEIIERLNPDCESRSVTVLDGAERGEQAIISDKRVIWTSDADGFVSAHARTLEALEDTGVLETAGRRIYTERIGQRKKAVICGAGHVSISVIRMAGMLGFHVTVADDRPSFADDAKRVGADSVICDEFERALEKIAGDADTFFIIVTRGHRWDSLCLRSILKKPHAYVGMMGSRRRVQMVKEQLKREGYAAALVDSVHTPIGLSIAARTPEEIAVSILAEIIQVKNAKRDDTFSAELLEAVNGTEHTRPLPGRKIMATIVARTGSAPRETGTKMLLTDDGTTVGTIGGGCTEAEVISETRLMFTEEAPAPRMLHVDMTADEAAEEGEVCGGQIDVWLQEI